MTTRRTSLDPEAVLRGRTSPDAASLCALIRSVNPTGLDLPAPERAHRYKQKSRLQSVLVRRFQDEIDVVRDGADGSEIVLLRHRPTGSSAGHAPVADLDEDARSWVRRTLDMQSAPRAPEPRPSSPGAPGTTVRFRERPSDPGESAGVPALIRAGKRAAAAYDYDLARRLFARALEATGGAPSPARLLLGLLVDELGADTEALALAESLDEEAAADPEVCARLSVAAARLGERTRARALARGLRDDVLARVLVCLGTSAVASGDLETAAHDLHEAKRADPSHLEIAALEAALERAMAARVEPLIERVFALLDAGRIDEAESAVRELRTAQAMAPRAREAILALEERRRAMRVAELVAEADRALERGLPEKAVGLLRQALLERPASAEDTERRLAEAERAHRDAVDGAGAAAVLRLLAAPDPEAGLLAYVALSEGARARVRAASPRRTLDLLDRTGVTGQGSRARSAVAAALALSRAEETLEADPEGALSLLARHERALEGIPEASAAVKRAHAVRRDRDREDTRRHVEEARRLLASCGAVGAGDRPGRFLLPANREAIERAAALLPEASLRLLGETERAGSLALRRAVDQALARCEFEVELFERVQRFDLAAARALVEERAAELAPEDPQAGGALRRWLDELVQRAFRVCVAGEGAAEIEARGLGRAVITGEAVPMPDAWSMGIQGMCETARLLRRRGSELIDVFARGRLLLIRVIDVTQVPHRIRALAALRLPQPFTLHTAEISGDALLATSWYGGILQVSLDGFRVRAYRPGRYDLVERAHEPLLALPRTFDNATVADDGRTVWILDKKYSRLRGVDVESMRTVHEERGEGVDWRVECSSGVAGSAFLFVNGTDAAELRTADGKRIPGGRFPVDLILSSSTAFPGGGVFVVTKKGEGHGARAVRLRPGEPPAPLLDLGPIPDGAFYCAATDRPSSRIFLLFEMVESAAPHRVLLALDARDGALHVLYRVEVPCRTLLVQDADTRIPSIVLVERGALRVLPLGESPPPLPALPDLLSHVTLPGIALYGATCQTMSKERSAEVERWKQMARASLDGHHSLSKAALDRNDPVELLDLGRALKAVVGNQVGRALEARAMLDHPDHPIVRWWRGYMEAANGSWENARDILQGIDPAPLDPGSARHFAHMLGLALLHAGEHDEAYRVLSRGAEHPGACALNGLLLIASPPGEEVVRDPADRPLCELLRLIAAADERLAEGDPERAAAILDDVLVWEVAEVQSLARLTRALLDVRSSAGADRRYRMLFALSHFLSAHETRSTDRNELFLRGRWLTPALDALAAEAQAWIDQELGG